MNLETLQPHKFQSTFIYYTINENIDSRILLNRNIKFARSLTITEFFQLQSHNFFKNLRYLKRLDILLDMSKSIAVLLNSLKHLSNYIVNLNYTADVNMRAPLKRIFGKSLKELSIDYDPKYLTHIDMCRKSLRKITLLLIVNEDEIQNRLFNDLKRTLFNENMTMKLLNLNWNSELSEKLHDLVLMKKFKIDLYFDSVPNGYQINELLDASNVKFFILNDRMQNLNEKCSLKSIAYLEVIWNSNEDMHHLNLLKEIVGLKVLVLSCNSRNVYYREIIENIKLPTGLKIFSLELVYTKEVRAFCSKRPIPQILSEILTSLNGDSRIQTFCKELSNCIELDTCKFFFHPLKQNLVFESLLYCFGRFLRARNISCMIKGFPIESSYLFDPINFMNCLPNPEKIISFNLNMEELIFGRNSMPDLGSLKHLKLGEIKETVSPDRILQLRNFFKNLASLNLLTLHYPYLDNKILECFNSPNNFNNIEDISLKSCTNSLTSDSIITFAKSISNKKFLKKIELRAQNISDKNSKQSKPDSLFKALKYCSTLIENYKNNTFVKVKISIGWIMLLKEGVSKPLTLTRPLSFL